MHEFGNTFARYLLWFICSFAKSLINNLCKFSIIDRATAEVQTFIKRMAQFMGYGAQVSISASANNISIRRILAQHTIRSMTSAASHPSCAYCREKFLRTLVNLPHCDGSICLGIRRIIWRIRFTLLIINSLMRIANIVSYTLRYFVRVCIRVFFQPLAILFHTSNLQIKLSKIFIVGH